MHPLGKLFGSSLLFAALIIGTQAAQAVQARTPTPSPTPTPSATSTPTASPTPPADQVSVFDGFCWLDAQPCLGEMTARIGGTVCARNDTPISPPPGGASQYILAVPSAQFVPGCGYEGATVEFFAGDQRAMRTGVWHAGSHQIMGFVAGHPFAVFGGRISVNKRPTGEALMPYVGDIPCGPGSVVGEGQPGKYGYGLRVYSNEQQAGCGVEGAQVTFKLLDAQGNVIAVAQEKGIWHVFDGVEGFQELDLTMIPVGGITLGNVGSGPDTTTDKTPWVGVALAALGLSGIAAGAALRKRAAR